MHRGIPSTGASQANLQIARSDGGIHGGQSLLFPLSGAVEPPTNQWENQTDRIGRSVLGRGAVEEAHRARTPKGRHQRARFVVIALHGG